MTKDQLLQIIDEIGNMQERDAFFLTGFYLSSENIRLIESEFTPDDPDVGAQGRFDGVPVFRLEEMDKNDPISAHKGIFFRFAKMDVVN